MNEIPNSSQAPKGGSAQCLHDAERNAAYVKKFKPGCIMYIGPSSEETWKFEKRKMGWACTTSHGSISCSLKWCRNFQKGSWSAKDDNGSHQFSQSHLYTVRNCSLSWTRKQDDLESRQNSASIDLTPRVLETVSLSRASVADDLSDNAWVGTGTPAARASIVDSDLFTISARAAEWCLQLVPNSEINRGSCRNGESGKKQGTCSTV